MSITPGQNRLTQVDSGGLVVGVTASYSFNYVDPVSGNCPVTITVGDGETPILKNGYIVALDSPEAVPLLDQWARIKLGL